MSDLDALVTAAQAGGIARVYKVGSVPARPDYPYAVASSAPGEPQVRTLDGSGLRAGRFVMQFFGRTAESVSALADAAFTTFDGREIAGLLDSPVAWQELASPIFRDPDDDGVLDITHTYRF